MVALGKGFITLEQIIEAIKIQFVEYEKRLKHRLISEILIERGTINTSQFLDVLNSIDERENIITQKILVRE